MLMKQMQVYKVYTIETTSKPNALLTSFAVVELEKYLDILDKV